MLCHNPSTVYYQMSVKKVWSSFEVQYIHRVNQDLSLKKHSKYVTWSIKPWLSPSWKNLLWNQRGEIAILATQAFRWLSWKAWPHHYHIENDLVPYCQGPVQDGEATDVPSPPPHLKKEMREAESKIHSMGSELLTVFTFKHIQSQHFTPVSTVNVHFPEHLHNYSLFSLSWQHQSIINLSFRKWCHRIKFTSCFPCCVFEEVFE